MIPTISDKNAVKEMLEGVDTVYVVGVKRSTSSWDRGTWRYFKLFVICNNKLFEIKPSKEWISEVKEIWSRRYDAWTSKTLGVDRGYEVTCILKRVLGVRNEPKVVWLN